MKKRSGTLAIVAILLVAMVATIGFAVGTSGGRSQPQSTPSGGGHQVAQGVYLAGLLTGSTTTSSNACGSWATDPNDPTYQQIINASGAIARCELLGYTWVLITAGIANEASDSPLDPPPPGSTYITPPAVMTFACAPTDSSCLSASSPHPYNSWQTTTNDALGFFKPMDLLTPTVFVAVGTGGQEMFDVSTDSWFTSASSALDSCAQSWGSYESSAQSANPNADVTTLEQEFIGANDGCTSAASS
jgi:hypothetical protein